MRLIKYSGLMGALTIAVLTLPGCASISESECQAGNWADLGYKDGVNGRSRDRIADYAETCGEHGFTVDRSAYLSSYESGLSHYCTYENGFERGKNGNSYDSVCHGAMAQGFRAGYDDGHMEYELRQKYEHYEDEIRDGEIEIQDVIDRLADPEISPGEKDRLAKKNRRLKRELKDLRWDFLSFKRKYNLDW